MDTILKDVDGKYISPLVQSSTVYNPDTQIIVKDDIDELKYVNCDDGQITITVYNGYIPYLIGNKTYVRDSNNKQILYSSDNVVYHQYQKMRLPANDLLYMAPTQGDLIIYEDGKTKCDNVNYRGNLNNVIYKNIIFTGEYCKFRCYGDNCSMSFYNCQFTDVLEAVFHCEGNNANIYLYNCQFKSATNLSAYCDNDYEKGSKLSLINCTFDKKIELGYFCANSIDLTGTVFKGRVYSPNHDNDTYNDYLIYFINPECLVFDYTPINGIIKNNVNISSSYEENTSLYFYMYISDDSYSATLETNDCFLQNTEYRYVNVYASLDSPCKIIGSNMTNFFNYNYNQYIEEFNTNLTTFTDVYNPYSGSLNKKSVETIFNMLGDFSDTNYSQYHSKKTTGTLTLNKSTLIYITDEMLALASTKGWTFVPSLETALIFYDSYYEAYEEYKKSIKHDRVGGTHMYLDGSIKLHDASYVNYASGKVDTVYDWLSSEDTGSTVMTIYKGNDYCNSNSYINVTSYINSQTKLKHIIWKDNYIFDNSNNQSILAPLEYVDFSSIDFASYNSKTDYSVSNYKIFMSTQLTRLYMWKNNGINLNFSYNPLDYISIKYLLTNSLLDLSGATSKTVVFSKTSYNIIEENDLQPQFAKLNWNIAYVEDPTTTYTF